jgi:hypothetical protein
MDNLLITADRIDASSADQMRAALLASEAINAALVRIIDSYVSQEGHEVRMKRLIPIHRKLKLAVEKSFSQGCARNGAVQCSKVAFETALQSAMASTESAMGFQAA